MGAKFAETKSVCPICLKVIPANKTMGADRFIHMEKTCPEHGSFDVLLWEGSLLNYAEWGNSASEPVVPKGARPVSQGCPYDCGLCEAHERDGCCVLIELTKRCNLGCPVCFAQAGGEGDLTLGEIGCLYDHLMACGGPFNIQLSGGEPTVRDDLAEIIRLGREKGFSFFQLNTNGLRIAQEEGYAGYLKAAGVSCVFLQFDGFRDETYMALRGRKLTDLKIKAIDRCQAAGLPVVLVPTVAPDLNVDEIGAILDFALDRAPHVRGVHYQPISYFGRCEIEPPPVWRLTIPRLLKEIEEQSGGRLKTEDFSGGGAESPYCSFHASYRILSDGSLKALQKRQSSCCSKPVKSSEARDFVARQWGKAGGSGDQAESREPSGGAPCCGSDSGTASLDAFLEEAVRQTFTVSGMLFQDAYNLDLDRLRRCYICEADLVKGMVPFCAYNLTDAAGKALYRK